MQLEAHLTCLYCDIPVFKLWRRPAEQEGGSEGVFLNRVTDLADNPVVESGNCSHCGGALTRRPVDG